VAAGQRDTDSHGLSSRFPEYVRSHPFVKDLPGCSVFALVCRDARRDMRKTSPNRAEIWYKLGVALGQQQREAVRLNGDHANSWYNRGG